jgi:SAM-dependent methyltransferase
MKSAVLDAIRCVTCRSPLDIRPAGIACANCEQPYPRVGRIPVLLPRPFAHVELWRRQLAQVSQHGRQAELALATAAEDPGLLPAGRVRLRAMGDATRRQVDEFVDLVGPSLGGPIADGTGGLPRGVVEYSYYLYRDWGWPDGEARENESAAGAIREVAGAAWGRTMVLGAGGCRLAYDLHRACGATETVAIDIDPYLFVIAEAIVRGATLQLTEASLNVFEVASVAKSWRLSAPDGPLDETVFHFLFANGLEPPFADGTFDTVLTPWFIDRVPSDLPAFIERVKRVLRPGGRWINHGALLYAPDTPLSRRYCRDEIFDLATRAGFEIEGWSRASRPYLVSPVSGSGKIESTLTFAARTKPSASAE